MGPESPEWTEAPSESTDTADSGERVRYREHAMHDVTYRFCPACAGALEPKLLKASEPPRLVCERCGFILYLDPKVAVGTIISADDGRLVLVKRAIQPGYGLWVFPGGYVDRGEQVTVAAIREAREESG